MKKILIVTIILLTLILGVLMVLLVTRQKAKGKPAIDVSPEVDVKTTTVPEQRATVVMPSQDPNNRPQGSTMPENEALRRLQNERLGK